MLNDNFVAAFLGCLALISMNVEKKIRIEHAGRLCESHRTIEATLFQLPEMDVSKKFSR